MKISKEWTGERAGREERAKSGIREIQGKSIISSAWQSPCILNHLQMLEDAGFDDVIAEDRTDQVCLSLWYTMLSICIFFILEVLEY